MEGHVVLCGRDMFWGPDGDTSKRWGDNIKMDFQEVGWKIGLD